MTAALLLFAGCGLSARGVKFLAPDTYVLPAHPVGELAAVEHSGGPGDEQMVAYAPEVLELGGRSFHAATPLADDGHLHVEPLADDVELSVYVRNTGALRRELHQVRALSGDIVGEVPTEVRFLDGGPLTLEARQLGNVYNGYRFGDGDLLVVEATRPGAPSERYLFRNRVYGLRTSFSAGVLLAPPMPFLPDQPDTTQPVLAGTLSVGWRARRDHGAVRWAGDHLAAVASVGIGSTSLEGVQGGDAEGLDQASGYFNAALAGVGVELYDFVSVQALANLSALSRNLAETPSAVAIGFDAVTFGVWTRDAGRRLLRWNPVDCRSRSTPCTTAPEPPLP